VAPAVIGGYSIKLPARCASQTGGSNAVGAAEKLAEPGEKMNTNRMIAGSNLPVNHGQA
jgi:hypothetical protein